MRTRKYLSIFLFILLLFLLQNPVSAIENPNKSYFVFSPDGKYLAKLFQTSEKTWIKIHETAGMETIAQWQIPDFQPHTVQFSAHESMQLLLADEKRLLVYELSGGKPEVKLVQPEVSGQSIIHATFDTEKNQVVWATKNTVFSTDLETKQDRRIASVERDKGTIKSIVPLAGGRIAVILKGDNRIYLFSPENPLFSEELNGHRAPLAGVQSPRGQMLFSVDENRDLIIWDITRRKISNSLHLGKPGDDSKVRGVSMDEPKKHLLVQSYSDPKGIGQRYAVSDLLQGRVDPDKQSVLATSAGNIYATADFFSVPKPEYSDRLSRLKQRSPVPDKTQRKNSFYDLAKIEADNENYEASLDFIKRISDNDPEYKQSRELGKRVRNQLELKSDFGAAMQQYQTGNLESAKILFENILAKNPDDAKTKRYLSLTESKLSKGVGLKVLLTILILILMGLFGFLVWKRQEVFRDWLGFSKKKSGAEPVKKKNTRERREFILKLDETKRMLKKAVALDLNNKYKDKWIEFSASLRNIEKRAKLKDKFLSDLEDQLAKMQQKILKLSPGSTVFRKKTETAGPSAETNEKRDSEEQSDRKQHESVEDPPEKKTKLNYYQVLGVDEKATPDQIKKAYHRKMQEYHPDKHNASDFKWVKEEADRMTKMIQEAYSILNDPQKRKQYQP
ncbi:DnaJ domain-containing protein [bacterium]|nr:DnaJ domain-containing protein [bacterium]